MASTFYRSLFPGTRLSPEKQSVSEFMTTEKGFRMSTSVGGVLPVGEQTSLFSTIH